MPDVQKMFKILLFQFVNLDNSWCQGTLRLIRTLGTEEHPFWVSEPFPGLHARPESSRNMMLSYANKAWVFSVLGIACFP